MSNTAHSKSLTLIASLWRHLSPKRRLQLNFSVILIIISAIAELLTVGSILPFLSFLSNPSETITNKYVQILFTHYGIFDTNQLYLLFLLVFVSVSCIASCIRLINLWFNGKISALIGHDISMKLYSVALSQDYDFYITNNSSEIITLISFQANRCVAAIRQALQILTSGFIFIFLLIGLILIQWEVATTLLFVFVLFYIFVIKNSRSSLTRNSEEIVHGQKMVTKYLQEGLGSIRDVIISNSRSDFVARFRDKDFIFRMLVAQNQFIASWPKFILEALGLVLLATFGVVISITNPDINIIAVLGGFALGFQKILPALQQVYTGWASVAGYSSDLESVSSFLSKESTAVLNSANYHDTQIITKFDNFSMENISFRYQGKSEYTLKNLSLGISKGDKIGIIGPSGSGKSTLIDLAMGLIFPEDGTMSINGISINRKISHSLSLWHSMIAHVPQSIFLKDATIAENIAFGIKLSDIDWENLVKSARQAMIYEHVVSLEAGFNTMVGERGVKLSGGQRQRIGLARAIYSNKPFLILDEATSALDTLTEQNVMNSIMSLNKDITMLIITHRKSTLKSCGTVYRLEGKCLVKNK